MEITASGVVATSSVDFVNTCFDLLEERKVLVWMRNESSVANAPSFRIEEVVTTKEQPGWCDRKYSPGLDDDLAQISFTSGTEGVPKGVLLKHRALNDVVTRLMDVMEIDSTISEYIGVPVNYSFGFGRCRCVATAGGRFFIPENGFNPLEIRNMAQEGSINAISAVPSLWRILLSSSHLFSAEVENIRWIEIGSQLMTAQEKLQLRELFPKAIIVQHYGLTEASRSTLLRIDQSSEMELSSVGKAYGKVEISISKKDRIMIRGPNVSETLLVEGKLKKNTDSQNWLTTNDRGYIKDGYLHFEGRADDTINLGGIKLSPEALENHVYQQNNLTTGIAICRIDDKLLGNKILLAYDLELASSKEALLASLLDALKKHGVNNRNAVTLFATTQIPSTETGKIQRRKLSKQFEEEFLKSKTRKENERDPRERTNNTDSNILSRWWSAFVDEFLKNLMIRKSHFSSATDIFALSFSSAEIDPTSSFTSLSGDSLTYVTVSMDIEQYLGYLPDNWHLLSIDQIDNLKKESML